MAIETERKFLVRSDAWRGQAVSTTRLRQGYVAAGDDRSIRVRIRGRRAFLTLKFGAAGPVREEFEYEVPVADAEAMLLHATDTLEKERHVVPWRHLAFEVDRFLGTLDGLTVAELETDEAVDTALLPQWIGREVTDDRRYYNAVLARDGLPKDVP